MSTAPLIEFSAAIALVVSSLILVSSFSISDTVFALNVSVAALNSLKFVLLLSIFPLTFAISDTVEALNVLTMPLIEFSAAVALAISLSRPSDVSFTLTSNAVSAS